MDAVIRALDVGYGNVKFVQEHSSLALPPISRRARRSHLKVI
jgi:hypothetical protein